jgi:hypothetical protein
MGSLGGSDPGVGNVWTNAGASALTGPDLSAHPGMPESPLNASRDHVIPFSLMVSAFSLEPGLKLRSVIDHCALFMNIIKCF